MGYNICRPGDMMLYPEDLNLYQHHYGYHISCIWYLTHCYNAVAILVGSFCYELVPTQVQMLKSPVN